MGRLRTRGYSGCFSARQETRETLHAWRTVTREVKEVAEDRHFLDWMCFGPVKHPRPAYIWEVEMVKEAGSRRADAQVHHIDTHQKGQTPVQCWIPAAAIIRGPCIDWSMPESSARPWDPRALIRLRTEIYKSESDFADLLGDMLFSTCHQHVSLLSIIQYTAGNPQPDQGIYPRS